MAFPENPSSALPENIDVVLWPKNAQIDKYNLIVALAL